MTTNGISKADGLSLPKTGHRNGTSGDTQSIPKRHSVCTNDNKLYIHTVGVHCELYQADCSCNSIYYSVIIS